MWWNILAIDEKQLEDDIWNLILNIKNNKFNFTKNSFKESYPVSQLIGPLNNNNFFSFKYISQYYCYNCLFKEEIEKYVDPIIVINEDHLKKI